MFISERVYITARFAKNPTIDRHVLSYTNQLEGKLKEVIAFSSVPLDCRFSRVRTEETGLGNFFADLIRTEAEADVSFFNSGSLRANMILPEGPFSRR